jgi:hypothetical protein
MFFMKNFALVAILSLFALLSFSSCKKDYKCTCNIKMLKFSLDSSGMLSDTTIVVVHDIDDAKKKQAEYSCDGSEEAYRKAASLIFGSADCELE